MTEAAAFGANNKKGKHVERNVKKEKNVELLEALDPVVLMIIQQLPLDQLRKVDLTCKFFHGHLKNDPLRKSKICTLFQLENSTLRAEKLTPFFHETYDRFVQSRTILFAWLVELADHFNVLTLTLHTTFIIVDRYFEERWNNIRNHRLELLGATSFRIAAWFHEVHPPPIAEIMRVCNDAYTEKEFDTMQKHVMQVQQWSLVSATPFEFAVAVCSMLKLPPKIMSTASYFMDLFMVQVDSVGVASSAIAGASVMFSCYCRGMGGTVGFESISRLSQTPEEKIRHIVCKMAWFYYLDYFTHNEFGKADKTVVRPLTDFENGAVNLRHSRLFVGRAAAPGAAPAPQEPPPRIKLLSTGSCYWCGEDDCGQRLKQAFLKHIDM